MIRPVTLLTFAAFIGSGLYLYQVKHQAQLVDRRIDKVHAATDVARERARLLQSEYARLNDPDRLASLAAAYVADLKPTQPGQWSSMAEIDRRLPGVGGPTGEPAPLEPPAPIPVEVPTASAAPAPSPAAESPRAAAHPAAVAQAAAPAPAPAPTIVAPAIVASASALRPLPRAAAPHPTPAPPARATVAAVSQAQINLAHGTPAPISPAPTSLAPAPVPIATAPLPVLRPPAAPMPSLLPRVSPPTGASVLAISTRPSAQTDPYAPPPAPMVASALGMARTMSPGTLYPQGTVR